MRRRGGGMPVSDFGALLVLDSPKCSLGEAALALVRLGVQALYANDLDEASLLARQEGARVRGALAPSSTTPVEVAEILEAVGPHTSVRPASLVLAGPRPDGRRDRRAARGRAALGRCGSRTSRLELRFLATLAVWEGSDSELRHRAARADLAARLRHRRGSHAARARARPHHHRRVPRDGGAARTRPPPRPRDRAAERRRSRSSPTCAGCARPRRQAPIERPVGAGVEFAPPQPAEAEALRAQMLVGMARFELRSKRREAARAASRSERRSDGPGS